jgi:hypothetical protein
MRLAFSPVTFAIAFSLTYAAVYWFNLPLFVYYPLHGFASFGPVMLKNAGPGMVWYGFMADCFIVATILALVIPDRWPDRLFRNYLWLFPGAAMLVCVYLLRVFFMVPR